MLKIACIGEAMIELQEHADNPNVIKRSVGGDTLNTAVYLKRLLKDKADVHYVTQLGDDPYSDQMIEGWKGEEINCTMIPRIIGKVPGLYSIKTDETGERQFYYWRDRAPAKDLFSDQKSREFIDTLADFDLIYFSGITLAILKQAGREKLLDLCRKLRMKGGKVAFDANYRPRLWTDQKEAQHWLSLGYDSSDIALPTFEDEEALWSTNANPLSSDDLLSKLLKGGSSRIAIKKGAEACLLFADGKIDEAAPEAVTDIIDTTAAGDSFNAGFLAASLAGQNINQAAKLGHQMAGRVITLPGAIIEHNQMHDIKIG